MRSKPTEYYHMITQEDTKT